MDHPTTVTSAEEAANLPLGQWVLDPDGRGLCLVDTHIGWPQRMWMSGAAYYALTFVTYPMVLAEVDGPCDHSAGTQECGHCVRCGAVVGEAAPLYPVDVPGQVAS